MQQTKIVVISITSWFMWIKCLYFLRIYDSTGYLIRMIVDVIYDMRIFIMVLAIALAAFADSLLIISVNSTTPFTTGFNDSMIFTYRIILGDFDAGVMADTKVPWLSMTLFLLCTIFNMIVMLNLLIAIISETFARVASNSDKATFMVKASLIFENNYLIPDYLKESYADQDNVLLVIQTEDSLLESNSDPTIQAI
jgi:hypothetical protein